MQPQAPYTGPSISPDPGQSFNNNPAPAPDYSFLDQQPKKSKRLPSFGGSFLGKIVLILIFATVAVIILIIVKSIVSPPPFNKAAYTVVIDRQNEMLHILNTDVTNAAQAQMTPIDNNFAATANLALSTAQVKTVSYLTAYKVKTDPKKLAVVFDPTIDKDLTGSLASNSFDGTFKAEMQQQLTSYQKEIKTAYLSSRAANGKSLLLSEYKEAGQLLTALNSTSS